MPYKDKARQKEAMKKIWNERLELIRRAKIMLDLPLDRRRKEKEEKQK